MRVELRPLAVDCMNLRYPLAVRAIWYNDAEGKLCWLNTLKLPHQEEVLCSNDPSRVARAIVDMEIRGAPAIGVAAALAVGAYALKVASKPLDEFLGEVNKSIEILARTRPTAYWLFYALSRLKDLVKAKLIETSDALKIAKALVEEALRMYQEHLEATIKMGELGSELVPDNATILTHCNTGALASCGYGSALGIIRIAWYKGKKIRVVATETRPMLQGARLTVYELVKEGIPVSLITDNAAGLLMKRGEVDLVVVGADRITLDGYVVNKVGTYMISLAAKRNNIPFYVAASTRTIDPEKKIDSIVIERRNPDEVRYINGKLITLENVDAINYAFDVTDPDLVTAIITERGIAYPPYSENLAKLIGEA